MGELFETELRARLAASERARQKAEALLESARALLRQKGETILKLTRGRPIEKVLKR
jgi:23S rRNA U2552 (ribose-2'-O)-methylase RlmE/FtsJ